MFCGVKLYLCNSHVLPRDILPYLRAAFFNEPHPNTAVRELCPACVHVWDGIGARHYASAQQV